MSDEFVKACLEEVWRRIESLEGQRFETKTGKGFIYTVCGEVLRVSRHQPKHLEVELSQSPRARSVGWPRRDQRVGQRFCIRLGSCTITESVEVTGRMSRCCRSMRIRALAAKCWVA